MGQDISEHKVHPKLKISTKGIASSANLEILNNFLSDNFLNYEVMLVEDSGHFPQEEKPEHVIKAILDFLN